MKNNYFNIIIPTRNRLVTLRHSLKTVLNQDYKNFKLIISDNNSADGTREFVESLNSTNIEYYNTGRGLSMSSNYEFALSKIKEGFVIVIGDDDGLLPSALKNLNDIINRENVLAISTCTALYYWPGGSPFENLLMIPRGKVKFERRKSARFIKKVLEGDLDYSELPMLYTGGIVHSSLIAKAKNQQNKFYNSFTPDVYSGIAIASVVNEYLRIEKIFAISGLSKFSNGQSQLGKNKDSSIAQVFFSENDIPFFKTLGDGKIKSIHFLTLEAYLQSSFLRLNDKIAMTRQFELVISQAPNNIKNEIKNYLREFCDFNPTLFSLSHFRIYATTYKFKLRQFIKRFNKFIEWDMVFVQGKVNNVFEASEYINTRSYGLAETINSKFKYLQFMIGRLSKR